MPSTRSAKKRVRVNERKRIRNMAERSALKTAVKRYRIAIDANDSNSEVYLKNAIKALDKAASKGIIHKNTAARTKSRLTKKLASQ